MPEHSLSLYIPCVYCNISKQYILETFRNMGLGEVSRIDFVKRQINNIDNSVSHPFNQAFVYFAYWNKNPVVDNLHGEIFDPDIDAKLVYDEPYFWRLLPNYNPRYEDDQNNDLRTVIIELQDKLDHQSNLLSIMSQRIFDLSYIINNVPKHEKGPQEEERQPEEERQEEPGDSQSFSNNKLPELHIQPTVCDNNNVDETPNSESSYDILGEEN